MEKAANVGLANSSCARQSELIAEVFNGWTKDIVCTREATRGGAFFGMFLDDYEMQRARLYHSEMPTQSLANFD